MFFLLCITLLFYLSDLSYCFLQNCTFIWLDIEIVNITKISRYQFSQFFNIFTLLLPSPLFTTAGKTEGGKKGMTMPIKTAVSRISPYITPLPTCLNTLNLASRNYQNTVLRKQIMYNACKPEFKFHFFVCPVALDRAGLSFIIQKTGIVFTSYRQ